MDATKGLWNAQEAATQTASNIMDNPIVQYALKIGWAIIVIILLLVISKIIANIVKKRVIRNSTPNNPNTEKIAKLVHDVVFYLLVIFSFFIGFEIVGFNVGLIIGWISFWVGLAFKEILWNMVAWLMILYTKEFKLGDIVEINADQIYFGKIEEITIRYTIIRTLDLRQVVLPNMTLITVPIKTFSSENLVKLNITMGVHYNSDIKKTLQVITETINIFDFVQEKPATKAFVSNFKESYIETKAFFSFDPKCGIISEVAIGMINEKINENFKANNIIIPFNTLTVAFETSKDKEIVTKQLFSTPQQ